MGQCAFSYSWAVSPAPSKPPTSPPMAASGLRICAPTRSQVRLRLCIRARRPRTFWAALLFRRHRRQPGAREGLRPRAGGAVVGLRRRRRRAAARRAGADRAPRRCHTPRRRRQLARQRQPREGLRRGGVCEDEGAAGGRPRRVVSAVACARCRSPCVPMHPVLQSGLTHYVSTTVRLTHFRPRVARVPATKRCSLLTVPVQGFG